MKRHILLYKNGVTAEPVVRDVGDYLQWFARVLDGRATLELHIGYESPRPELRGYDGVVLTGSPRSLVEPEPWMAEAADFVRNASTLGVPVLGVCFGHQLIGWAWGGEVRINPRGWEAGSHEVELTDDGARDPLFLGMPRRLRVNQSHRDEVARVGEGVVRLARNDHTDVQAVAVGDHVRGVQFHPEMSGPVIRRIIEHRRALLRDDAIERGRDHTAHPEHLLERSSDAPEAERILDNFVTQFVQHA